MNGQLTELEWRILASCRPQFVVMAMGANDPTLAACSKLEVSYGYLRHIKTDEEFGRAERNTYEITPTGTMALNNRPISSVDSMGTQDGTGEKYEPW